MSRVSGLAERIRLRALQGELRAGEWLVEVQLARAYDVQRWTIREALRQLEGRGLLVADTDGGMRVAAPDAAELAEALEARAALEAMSAAAAARRMPDAAELDPLRALTARPVPGGPDTRARLLADRTFHRALDGLARNRPAHEALDGLWDRLVVGGAPCADPGDHARLLDRIAAGDADGAADLARRHVLASAG